METFLVVVILFPEEYNRTHSICTTFKKSIHKCIPLAVAREAEAHRADNRYFNNDTAGGKQGARGIFYCSQMCRAHYILKMSGSISKGLIFTYSLMIQHGANKYDIMTVAKHAHKLLLGVTNLVISFNKVFRDSFSEAFFIQMRINQVELIIP